MAKISGLCVCLIVSFHFLIQSCWFFRVSRNIVLYKIRIFAKLHSFKHLFKSYSSFSLLNHFLIHSLIIIFIFPTLFFNINWLLSKLWCLFNLGLRFWRWFILISTSTFAFTIIRCWWLRSGLNRFRLNISSLHFSSSWLLAFY